MEKQEKNQMTMENDIRSMMSTLLESEEPGARRPTVYRQVSPFKEQMAILLGHRHDNLIDLSLLESIVTERKNNGQELDIDLVTAINNQRKANISLKTVVKKLCRDANVRAKRERRRLRSVSRASEPVTELGPQMELPADENTLGLN